LNKEAKNETVIIEQNFKLIYDEAKKVFTEEDWEKAFLK
jgi:hypothetical protein